MDLLVIGGTMFLGRHVVEHALAAGHRVTMFNRGKTNPDLFPGVERVRGDRTADLSALDGRTFDAVVDTCGYVPRVVRESAKALSGSAGHYTFVSSCSVYADFPAPGCDEDAPVATLDDPTVEEITAQTYGPLKALSEQAAAETFDGPVLNVRPGLIVGPHDPTDRFTYWPVRVARGGEVLAPAPPDQPVQFIDGRDLASWIVRAAEQRLDGVYNAVGDPIPIDSFLDACKQEASSDASITWVDPAFLLERDVHPWATLPMWLTGDDRFLNETSNARAVAAGMTFRPVREIVRDTLEWDATRTDRKQGPQLTLERESELLTEWHTRAD